MNGYDDYTVGPENRIRANKEPEGYVNETTEAWDIQENMRLYIKNEFI